MNNNEELRNTDLSDSQCDRMIEQFIDTYSLPPVDTTGIEVKTHMKILQDGLERSRRRWRIISLSASAACVALICIITGLLMHPLAPAADSALYTEAEAECTQTELIVPTGQRMTIMLPDGTRVIANSRSTLRYPSRFSGDTRAVWASGEVFFDVAKDPAKPFIVSSNGFNIRVYGTKFNLSNYNPDHASVVLVEGSVAVTTDKDEKVNMQPGHLVAIERGAIEEVRKIDHTLYTSWTEGGLRLDDRTLGDVAQMLSTYYDVNIDVEPALADRNLYGCLDLKSKIDDIIDVLSTIIPMQVDADSTGYRLSPAR